VKCLLLQAGVGLGWTEDFQLISKLLSEVEVEAERLTPFHRRKLKPTAKLILDYYPALKSPFLQDLAIISVPLDARESRWSREVAHILTKMEVKIEKRPLVHEQQMDYVMDRRVLTCLGPYSYYSSSTHRTAISKMHQRVLEVEGYTVSAIPYFEWSEIKTEEDKMVYLWSLGRRVASGELVTDAEPACEEIE